MKDNQKDQPVTKTNPGSQQNQVSQSNQNNQKKSDDTSKKSSTAVKENEEKPGTQKEHQDKKHDHVYKTPVGTKNGQDKNNEVRTVENPTQTSGKNPNQGDNKNQSRI